MKPHANTTPAEPVAPRPLPSAKVQFPENIFAAVRTAGAFLVGNSALIYFGILGTHVAACPGLINSHTQVGGKKLDIERDEIKTKSL